MKSDLTKLSVALLSAVFLLACQDQGPGPVGPDDLVPQFAKVKNCDPDMGEVHPSCKPPPPGPPLEVSITVAGEFSLPDQPMSGPGILDEDFMMNLSNFPGGCTLGTQDGVLFIPQGADPVHVHFSFMHKVSGSVESSHALTLEGVLQSGVLPPILGTPAVIMDSGAPWVITSTGKGHKNGCKGAGDAVPFTVTIVQPPPA